MYECQVWQGQQQESCKADCGHCSKDDGCSAQMGASKDSGAPASLCPLQNQKIWRNLDTVPCMADVIGASPVVRMTGHPAGVGAATSLGTQG